MITFVPTTAEHVAVLFGGPPNLRMRAMTALVDGEPAAIGGLAYQADGTALACLHGYGIAKRFPVAVHKAVRAGLAAARVRGVRRIVTFCDEDVEAAPRWLARLGFRQAGERVWIWEG